MRINQNHTCSSKIGSYRTRTQSSGVIKTKTGLRVHVSSSLENPGRIGKAIDQLIGTDRDWINSVIETLRMQVYVRKSILTKENQTASANVPLFVYTKKFSETLSLAKMRSVIPDSISRSIAAAAA